MEQILISNLNEIVKNTDELVQVQEKDKWMYMEYTAKDIHGNMLVSSFFDHPADLILAPNVKGWCKVFVAFVKMGGSFNLKMTGAADFTEFAAPTMSVPAQWQANEFVPEFFWCAADMTDKEITLQKAPGNGVPDLCWLRFIPMTDEEVKEYLAYNAPAKKNTHAQFGAGSAADTTRALRTLENTDVNIATLDVPLFFDEAAKKDAFAAYKAQTAMVQSYGVKLYAGYKLSLASAKMFFAPNAGNAFVEAHPECAITTRDGRALSIASYAYPAVQDFMIGQIKDAVACGFDGVSLYVNRGMLIAFEQPVLDAVSAKYGVDARTLTADDARLNGVWCEIMTAFVKRLGAELDKAAGKHIAINLISDFEPATAKRVGIDVEALSAEKAIDSVCQGLMEYTEVLDGCLKEDGTVDLDAYKEMLKTKAPVSRIAGESLDKIKAGIPAYLALAEKHGIDFYAFMCTVRSRAAQYIEWMNALKELGVTNFSTMNFSDRVGDIPRRHLVSKLGHDEIDTTLCEVTAYHTMSLNDSDMSTYVPNWRG